MEAGGAAAQDDDVDRARMLLEAAWRARELARAPVSGFRVGAAALDARGAVHLGHNVEFAGAPLGETLHAEHAAVAVARAHAMGADDAEKEEEVELCMIAVTAAPCGHCRQMLAERFPRIRVVLGGESAREPAVLRLSEDLLPRPVTFDLLSSPPLPAVCVADLKYAVATSRELDATSVAEALASFARADARFSGWPRACVFISAEGTVLASGGCMESVAFNPTLGCFQAAFMALAARANKLSWRDGLPLPQDIGDKAALDALVARVKEVVLVQYEGALVDDRASVANLAAQVFGGDDAGASLPPLSTIQIKSRRSGSASN